MMLCRFGPRRLSPSLVVWQVRHVLLNISCPDPASAPARTGSWGTAEDDSRIRNVEQNKFFRMRDRRDASRHKIAQHFRKVNHTKAMFRGSKPRRRDGRKHASHG
jgi:hypothetical protein